MSKKYTLLNNIKYKDLIGTSFTVNDPKHNITYYFGKRYYEASVILHWTEHGVNQTATYPISTVLKYIKDGTWIIENKFYRNDKLKRINKN